MVGLHRERALKQSLEVGSEAGVVAAALRAIRKKRGMTVVEVAAAMGLARRTFEEFEAGRGPITHERIFAFADATDSDPFAILLCPMFKHPTFAVDCADTKLVMILMMQLEEFVDREGSDITYLEPLSLIGGSERLFKDLSSRLAEQDGFLEKWFEQRTGSIGIAALRRRLRNPRAGRLGRTET